MNGRREYTSLEICAGAGGQALGLEFAGFKHVALVELESEYCDCLRHNRPEWNVICQDVHSFCGTPFREKIDLLAGGVPCPPFSVAGKQLGEGAKMVAPDVVVYRDVESDFCTHPFLPNGLLEATAHRIAGRRLLGWSGDIDCVYHFALPELIQTIDSLKEESAADMLKILVEGKRLKDISDLPLDLAV